MAFSIKKGKSGIVIDRPNRKGYEEKLIIAKPPLVLYYLD